VLNEKSTMRRLQRLIAASVLIALTGALAGCSSSISSFDPMDWLDWIDTKKKLQGDRKPVFPEGVPGVEQGVPKSLYKGAQETNQNAPEPVPVPPPPAETKKTAKKKQPAPTTASTDALTEEDTTAAAPQAPKKKIVRQRTTAPPPDQPADAQQPAQSGAQTQQSAFPAPLPGGTVTR
jgi:outer membrane biosynthesis protein TonB